MSHPQQPARSGDSPRELWAINLGQIPYDEALALQRTIVAAKKRGEFQPDLLLLLEHPPVITLGRRGETGNIVATPQQLDARGIAVHHVERGGDVTYHGPGQLVGYPIVALRHLPQRKDVRNFVWNMQEAIIRTLAHYGITGERIDNVIGVWVRSEPPALDTLGWDEATASRVAAQVTPYPDRKIAAIGARIEGWISFHGFALNVTTNLDDFNLIIACGLEDRGVTSMEVELGRALPLDQVRQQIAGHLAELWGFTLVEQPPSVLAPFRTTRAAR